ncbi:MAG TPA: YjgN family protein [Chthoniobacterales bacterium]|nr:YjgN family protein [Chthoniobacterales bacterium]
MEEPTMEVSAKSLEFRGAGGEYFGIWIVNLLLCIVTLGIYIPWARVRTRRYFHRNTVLDGHSFDYVADPKRLLIGYLIVGAFFIIYMVSGAINPLLALPIILIFWLALPWLRYKSARFYASNSTYRNLRFRFDGTLGEAYTAYLGFPLLAMVTLGLLSPYASFKGKEYYLGHFSFGSFHSTFTGKPGWFFKVLYLLAFGGIVGIAVVVGIFVTVAASYSSGAPHHHAGHAEVVPSVSVIILTLAVYGGMFLLLGLWLVLSKNYCWNHLVVNPGPSEIAFRSQLKVGKYLWIVLSNIVLTVLTVGLFAPFAAVRLYKYRVTSLSITGGAALDDAMAVISSEPNAIGDSASDLFDFEFGL